MVHLHKLLFTGATLLLLCRTTFADPAPGLKTYTEGPFQADAGFVPDKTEIKVGEPLWVTEHLFNSGTKPFKIDYIGWLEWWNLRVNVVDPAGHSITHNPTRVTIDQLSGPKIVAPGAEAVEHALVTVYSPVVSPGIYTVTCERYINLAPPAAQSYFEPILNIVPKNGRSSLIDIVSTFTVQVDPCNSVEMGQVIDHLGTEALAASNTDSDGFVTSLSNIHDVRVIPWLAGIIKRHDPWSENAAMEGLSQFSTVEAALALAPALGTDGEPWGLPHEVLTQIESNAGAQKNEVVLALRDFLLPQLHDKIPGTRSYAALAIADAGDFAALGPLILATHDSVESVRCAAAESIGDLGDQDGRPALLRGLNSKDPAYRQACKDGLKELEWFLTAK